MISMNAKELRIGSKVLSTIHGGATLTVKEIDKHSEGRYVIFFDESDGTGAFDTQCSGIPLSPDILLKCGCKQDAESKKYNYDDYVSNDLFVRIEKDRYQIVINKGHVIYMDAPYHLHQLQNLIHALTGQELNIKL